MTSDVADSEQEYRNAENLPGRYEKGSSPKNIPFR
jgi:hypothetical protein